MTVPRHYDTIATAFVAVLLISNIASTKILDLGPFTFDGGTLLFPLSYIFGDILTEVYGFRRSRRVIWQGFGALAVMAGTLAVVGALPPSAGWPHQESYETILGLTPRLVAASLVAYFAGEFSNAVVLARMKVRMEGRHLWMRTLGSTVVGQAVDTGLFVSLAFWGVVDPVVLKNIAVSNYVFKCAVEAVFTPATYAITAYLKKSEGVDFYDRKTRFNPFGFAAGQEL